jgi:nitroreductase
MDFFDLIQKRHSVRSYRPDPVEDEKLMQVLEAARLAPTAANRQPFGLVVAHTADRKGELGQVYGRPWFVQAPLVIAACGISSQGWTRPLDGFNALPVDIGIVMDHLTLAAAALGLGTCWIANFNTSIARWVFGLPEGVEPLILTPLGYPDDQPQEKLRKPLSELIHTEKW